MTLLDAQALFSDDQAITASAASTNYINLGATLTPPLSPAALKRDLGASEIPLLIQVTEDFATLTSLTIAVQVDDNSAFSTPKEVASSGAIPVASLVAGKKIPIPKFAIGSDEQYVRLYYTVTGTNATAGKILAGVTTGVQTNGVQ